MVILLTQLGRAVLFLVGAFGVLLVLTIISDWHALLASDTNRNDPVLAREILSYEIQKDGTVTYQYVAEALPLLLVENEVPELRTEASYTKKIFTTAKGADIYELVAYSSKNYVEREGQWFARETGTTDRATFALRRQGDVFASLFWKTAQADSIAPFSHTGDGQLLATVSGGAYTWTDIRLEAFADSVSSTQISVRSLGAASPLYQIERGVVPFDTSALPAGASISAASLNLYAESKTNTGNDGSDFVTVVQTSQATHTTLAVADYNDVGTTEGIATGSRIDIGSISISAYNVFPLNSTGISWIKGVDNASSCSATAGITCLGILEGHDFLNDAILNGEDNLVVFSEAETSGTSQDPYLSVTYTTSTDTIVVLTSGTSWNIPGNWDDVANTIETIGGGAGGVTGSNGDTGQGATGGRGGGGGAYASISSLPLGGGSVEYQIGQGGTLATSGTDTFFNRTAGAANNCDDTVSVCADAGLTGSGTTGGAGGLASNSDGTTKNNGGSGGNAGTFTSGHDTGSGGGGGGGAGGSGSAGTTGSNGGASVGADSPGGAGGAGGAGGTPNGGTGGSSGVGAITPPTTVAGDGGRGSAGTGTDGGGPGGGGGGGGGAARDTGANSSGAAGGSGLYGGGGGGGGGGGRGNSTAGDVGTAGSNGVIIITYTPVAGGDTQDTLSKPPNNLGLMGYWSLNEGTGSVVTDFSGNFNVGTFTGGSSPTWTNGKRSMALSFDNTDDIVTIPNSASLDITGLLSLSFWVKPGSVSGDRSFFAKSDGILSPQYFIGMAADELEFCITGDFCADTTSANLVANTWYHVVVTYSDAGNAVIFYVNGSAVADDSGTAESNSIGSATYPLILGEVYDGFPANATLDDVRIYNRVLGSTEAFALANAGAAKLVSSAKALTAGTSLGASGGLIGHWSFDGADFTDRVTDASGNGNTGFLFNTATSTMRINGKLGQAFNTDGTDDYMRITTLNHGIGTGDFTWSAWVYPRAVNVYGAIMNVGSFSPNMALQTNTGTSWGAYWGGDLPSGGSTLSVNTWYHFVMQREGTTLRFYENGVLTPTSHTVGTSMANGIFEIGRNSTGGHHCNCIIDDSRFYNRALSATEIKQLSQLGKATIMP